MCLTPQEATSPLTVVPPPPRMYIYSLPTILSNSFPSPPTFPSTCLSSTVCLPNCSPCSTIIKCDEVSSHIRVIFQRKQTVKMLIINDSLKKKTRAGTMAQWVKHSLHKCENQNSDPQPPCKCWVGMAACCNPSTQEA